MALTRLPSFTLLNTDNFTFANVTITGNVTSNNANLGNVASANYFIGNGSLLTGLPESYTNSNVASYLPTYTGNVGANIVTANYFVGAGNSLSNIQGANVSGYVANATHANVADTANSVAVANVTGIGNIATINKDGNSSNILYGNGVFAGAPITYANSNAESYLPTYTGNISPGNLTVSGKTVLGNVGNVTITGGASGQLLQTDGLGNVNWVTPTGTTITVDNFTANGVQTDFTLSVTPASELYTLVAMAGTLQPRSVYTLTGNVITFSSAPPNTAPIEITTFSSVMGFGTSDIVANSFTANTLTANTLSGNIISSSTNLTVNTLSANSVTNTGTGIPTINSATSINLTAATVVRSTSSPFQFYNCTTTVRDTIAASNGYVIYNTTTDKLQVYVNGSWVDLH